MAESDTSLSTAYPGVRRLPYFLVVLGIYVALGVSQVMLGEDSVTGAVLVLIALVGLLALAAQRFRNQGASAWWALGFLVPIFNIYVAVRALAYQEGYMAVKKLDRTGKIVVVIYLLIVVLGIVAAIALPAYQSYIEAAEAARQT